MRGNMRKRYKDSWNIILDVGYQFDPESGKEKQVQKWFTVQGTKRDAEKKSAELLHNLHRSEYVEPSKLIVGHGYTSGWRRPSSPQTSDSAPMKPIRASLSAILSRRLAISACSRCDPRISSAITMSPRCHLPP
jgi:hypothetical protein